MPQLAQRLHQLSPEPFNDVINVISHLQRRRDPLCWCLLLLGGRADVQVAALVSLHRSCTDPADVAYLLQRGAGLQQRMAGRSQAPEGEGDAATPCLLPGLEGDATPLPAPPSPSPSPPSPPAAAATATATPPAASATAAAAVGDGGGDVDAAASLHELVPLLGRLAAEPARLAVLVDVLLHRRRGALPALLRHLSDGSGGSGGRSGSGRSGGGGAVPEGSGGDAVAEHAARALACLSAAADELKEQLVACGAVPLLLRCLAAAMAAAPSAADAAALGGGGGSPGRSAGGSAGGGTGVSPPAAAAATARMRPRLAEAAATALGHACTLEVAGREVLRAEGHAGLQVLLGPLSNAAVNGAAGTAAVVTPILHALANMSAHPPLRPGLLAAGTLDALHGFVMRSGGTGAVTAAAAAAAGGVGGGGAAASAATAAAVELALLALVRCARGSVSGVASLSLGVGPLPLTAAAAAHEGLFPGGLLQLLLDVVALPVPYGADAGGGPGGGGGVAGGRQQKPRRGDVGGEPRPSTAQLLVLEAAEALADLSREPAGALAVLEAAGHLVLLARLLDTVPSVPVSGAAPAASSPIPTTPAPTSPTATTAPTPSLASAAASPFATATSAATSAISAAATSAAAAAAAPLPRRLLDACLRCLTRVAVAAPGHPDLRAARTHEALLAVLLGFGLAERPGWWALQGLCALAADGKCASDLVSAGLLPPVVAALRGLAEQGTRRGGGGSGSGSGWSSRRTSRDIPPPAAGGAAAAASAMTAAGFRGGYEGSDSLGVVAAAGASGGGGGGGARGGGLSRRDTEVAHLLGLLLQTMASHKALARAAVAEGAVQAVCEWLGACVAAVDVEGAVLCCATLCLLGDGDVGALVDMVHADGIGLLVELLHPRWASAALVPATVASAVAVACRWPASAQAVRMAAGIPALADLLRGPHGQACCRPVVNAFVDLIANDPPSLRDIRTTNTVIALGMQLQLLPNNDPRAANIRVLLRTLGEDPDTAMRLANNEADNALAVAAALYAAAAASAGGAGADGGGSRVSDAGDRSSAGSADWHHRRWRLMRPSDGSLPVPSHHHLPNQHSSHHHHVMHLPPRYHSYGAAQAAAAAAAAAAGSLHSHQSYPSHASVQSHASRRSSSGGSPVGMDSGEFFTEHMQHHIQAQAAPGGRAPKVPTAAAAGSGGGGGGARSGAHAHLHGHAHLYVRGESSYKSLRRASLRQLAQRMDASDFSDVEDDVEDYMALLHAPSSDTGYLPSAQTAQPPGRVGSFNFAASHLYNRQGSVHRSQGHNQRAHGRQAADAAAAAGAPSPFHAAEGQHAPPPHLQQQQQAHADRAGEQHPPGSAAALTAVAASLTPTPTATHGSALQAQRSLLRHGAGSNGSAAAVSRELSLVDTEPAAIVRSRTASAAAAFPISADSDGDDEVPMPSAIDLFELEMAAAGAAGTAVTAAAAAPAAAPPPPPPEGRRTGGGGFVSTTLAAVNPLRLFGVGRRAARRSPAGASSGGGGRQHARSSPPELPAPPAAPGAGSASRGQGTSLQVEGDELVYWLSSFEA